MSVYDQSFEAAVGAFEGYIEIKQLHANVLQDVNSENTRIF